MTTRDKAIDRAAKLRTQMESEHKLGNSEAAEAFATMMQRLMLEHALNDAEIEQARLAGQKVVEEPIVERKVDLLKAGIEPRQARSANLEALAHIVGRAHLCKILIRPCSNDLWFVGTAKHGEVAEYMFITLQRNLQKIAKDAYERHYAAVDGDTTQTRGFIASFKRAFLQRLDERYYEERQRVVAEHDATSATGDCTALMRLDNALQRVQAYINHKYARVHRATQVGVSRRLNAAGERAGHRAADSIALRANGVGTSRPTPKELGA